MDEITTLITIIRHSKDVNLFSQCTPQVRNLQLARQEEHALQIDVANLYETHLATRHITNKEYLLWENLSVAMGADRKCASDLSERPHQSPSIIRLARYMNQLQVGSHVTLLLLEKDCFGVEIERIYVWWLKYY